MNPTLFKMDANGKIRVWTIWVEHYKSRSVVFTRHGINGHKQTISESNFAEYNHHTTSVNWMNSQINYMVDRKGYTEQVPTCKPFRPMLLQSYKNRLDHIPPQVYIQPKLNGMRCLASSSWMKSREGVYIKSLPQIQEVLSSLSPETVVDGELYCHNLTLQEILSIVKRDSTHPKQQYISFIIYDLVDEQLTFKQRLAELSTLEFPVLYPHDMPHTTSFVSAQGPNDKPVGLLDTLLISKDDIEQHFKYFLANNYEGAVIRLPNAHYQINVRSPGVLKLKPFQKANCLILDIIPCEREPKHGRLVLRNPRGGTFTAQIKGSHHYRMICLANKAKYIGQLCAVEFEDYSADNVPLKAVGVHIHV